ncbi:MAG: methonine synthase [Candidatus Altiarchaeota archaeon]
MTILSDDIGSFPPPAGFTREDASRLADRIVTGKASEDEKARFNRTVVELMDAKVSAGIEAPNYPQLRDMIESFYALIENHSEPEEPFVILKENAVMPEVDAVGEYARRHYEEVGEPLNLRVCVTGPIDLYVRKISTQVDGDLLKNLGKSVGRFLENARLDEKHVKTRVVSIDEPSLGLNPNIIVEQEDLIEAWNLATDAVKDLDVQVHLHSSAEAETVYQTDSIRIIGVESAEDPDNLKGFEKKDLDSYDRFLRVGVSRSNITGMIADYEKQTGVNATGREALLKLVDTMEDPITIRGRLEKAYNIFGDRIKYAGPDCGLGLWPDINAAARLLENTAKSIAEFNKNGG